MWTEYTKPIPKTSGRVGIRVGGSDDFRHVYIECPPLWVWSEGMSGSILETVRNGSYILYVKRNEKKSIKMKLRVGRVVLTPIMHGHAQNPEKRKLD